MSFYHYSNPQTTLDLDDPQHVDLIRQFVAACKLELQKRSVKTGRKPFAEPPEFRNGPEYVLERSPVQERPRRRRTPCST